MITTLEKIDSKLIVDCLNKAFSDYKIPMEMPTEYWLERWDMAFINYSLSFAYFENNQMSAFILHGVDLINDSKCFYNMGTGAIPSSRGQRLVKKLYEKAIPRLKNINCNKGNLEVLSDNTKAIRAYNSVGFEIEDELISFNIPQNLKIDERYKLVKSDSWNQHKYDAFKCHKLSFEHRDSIIKNNPSAFHFYELHLDESIQAYAILKVSNKNIIQFGFKNNNYVQLAAVLFAAINEMHKSSRIINISKKDSDLLDYLYHKGFELYISQYSMSIDL